MNLPRQVYHLAEEANWPSIERLGLLPASELIVRAGLVREMVACLDVSDASCLVMINRNDLISDYVLSCFHPIDRTTDELYPVVSLPALRRPGGG